MNNEPATQAVDPEFEKRAKVFLDEYGELTKKHNIDIAAYPVYMPDGQGGFKTMIQQSTVDTKDQPYRSPFMSDENGGVKDDDAKKA